MIPLSELKLKHAKRISYHLMRIMRFYNISSVNECELVEFFLAGGNLQEVLNSIKSGNDIELKVNQKLPLITVTSLSLVAGNNPDDFIEKFSKALFETQEAELLKTRMTNYV